MCLQPGTEIAFSDGRVARFRQIDLDCKIAHHDAVEFSDGKVVRVNKLGDGLEMTVLQLPATPKPVEVKTTDDVVKTVADILDAELSS